MYLDSVVFLPGFGFKSSIAEIIFKQFKNNFIRMLDLPQPDINLDAVLNWLRVKIHQPMIWVGWSLGGLLALAFCYRYPFLCRKLIMICSTPKFMAEDNWPGLSQAVLQKFQDNFLQNATVAMHNFAFGLLHPHSTKRNYRQLLGYIDFSSLAINRRYLTFLQQCDLRNAFQNLKMPVQLLLTEKDVLLPIELAPHLNQLNPHAKISILPDMGHAPFITHQQNFASLLSECLVA